MKTTWRRLFWWMLLVVCWVVIDVVVAVALMLHFCAAILVLVNLMAGWLHSANCVATKFRGRFVESASFSSSSSSISSSSSRRRLIDELLLLSSPWASLPASPNCCVRKKCGSKKCGCKLENRIISHQSTRFVYGVSRKWLCQPLLVLIWYVQA